MKNAFTGSWRITNMELWDEEARDLLGPAYIKFGSDGPGDKHATVASARLNPPRFIVEVGGDGD